jgi:hypothetical protein
MTSVTLYPSCLICACWPHGQHASTISAGKGLVGRPARWRAARRSTDATGEASCAARQPTRRQAAWAGDRRSELPGQATGAASYGSAVFEVRRRRRGGYPCVMVIKCARNILNIWCHFVISFMIFMSKYAKGHISLCGLYHTLLASLDRMGGDTNT